MFSRMLTPITRVLRGARKGRGRSLPPARTPAASAGIAASPSAAAGFGRGRAETDPDRIAAASDHPRQPLGDAPPDDLRPADMAIHGPPPDRPPDSDSARPIGGEGSGPGRASGRSRMGDAGWLDRIAPQDDVFLHRPSLAIGRDRRAAQEPQAGAQGRARPPPAQASAHPGAPRSPTHSRPWRRSRARAEAGVGHRLLTWDGPDRRRWAMKLQVPTQAQKHCLFLASLRPRPSPATARSTTRPSWRTRDALRGKAPGDRDRPVAGAQGFSELRPAVRAYAARPGPPSLPGARNRRRSVAIPQTGRVTPGPRSAQACRRSCAACGL